MGTFPLCVDSSQLRSKQFRNSPTISLAFESLLFVSRSLNAFYLSGRKWSCSDGTRKPVAWDGAALKNESRGRGILMGRRAWAPGTSHVPESLCDLGRMAHPPLRAGKIRILLGLSFIQSHYQGTSPCAKCFPGTSKTMINNKETTFVDEML